MDNVGGVAKAAGGTAGEAATSARVRVPPGDCDLFPGCCLPAPTASMCCECVRMHIAGGSFMNSDVRGGGLREKGQWD